MIKDIAKQPLLLRAWIMFMVVVNLCSLFFLQYYGARWILALNLGSFLLMSYMYKRFSYSRILGLPHVLFWTPLVFIIWQQMKLVSASSVYGVWLRFVFITNSISLVFDYLDVTRFCIRKS